MDESAEAGEQQRLTAAAVRHCSLEPEDVWLRYFSNGGAAGAVEVELYLNQSLLLPAPERDLLSQAVNELIDELPPPPRATYSAAFST